MEKDSVSITPELRVAALPAFEIDFLESYDVDSITAELRRVAELLGKRTLSLNDIRSHARVGVYTVREKFGTLRKANEAAGLLPSRFMKPTRAELLGIVVDLWTITREESGRSPMKSELSKFGFAVSAETIVSRFGSWRKALIAAAKTVPGQATPAETVTAPAQRAAISIRKRFLVFKRDRYRCRICRRAGEKLEVDHVVPVHHGGSDMLDNLQTLCFDCNRGKRDSLQ